MPGQTGCPNADVKRRRGRRYRRCFVSRDYLSATPDSSALFSAFARLPPMFLAPMSSAAPSDRLSMSGIVVELT